MTKHVVVVGAGPGGLCAAMLLASRGFQVTVLEKQAAIGGRSGALQLGPYSFDRGSTMLMMRFVLEEMFDLAGRRLEDELTLTALDPMYRLVFAGSGHALDVFSDVPRMQAELERFRPGSSPGLARFLQGEQQRLSHLYPVLQRSYPHLTSLLAPALLAALPHVGIGRSLYRSMGSYFDDPELRLAFSFQSAYLGMSPWSCPGGFGMVPYVEHAWGIDHIQGGIHRLCEALERVARDHGACIRTEAPVSKLWIEQGRARGVELAGGERVAADDVVINADAAEALHELLDRDVSLRFNRHHLTQLDESCSTYMLYLGLDTVLPLRHHTFFFASDYRREMEDVFERGSLGTDSSLYVCNPSVTDATLAPAGHSALYLLALVPNTRADLDWKREGPALRERLLSLLEVRAGCAVRPHIRAEAACTPSDWAADYAVSHGAVFGPAHRIGQLLAFRLPNQLPSLPNVFLAGGGTSPGSGLPTILESGRIAARLISGAHGQPFPASRPLPAKPTFAIQAT